MSEIRFGTNGWRGVLGRDFDADGAERVAHALARESAGARVVVAFDTRAQADVIAARVAAVLAGAGVDARLCSTPTPTPVAARLVRALRADAGVVITASHNPPEYLGLKVLARGGEGAPRALLTALAQRANAKRQPRRTLGAPRAVHDAADRYVEALLALVDRREIARARPRVLYDAMHGAGAGVLDRALRELGARVEVMRGAPDPRFGGGAPDPTPRRLRGLAAAVKRGRFAFGVASDGDADRFALVDARGRVLSESESLALLVDHVAATRRLRRGLAISHATGSLVERVARARWLGVVRTGLGFSPLARALRSGDADLAGEESGGFAWRALGLDKDGMLAAALALEAAAAEPLHARTARLAREVGAAACGRAAIGATAAARRTLSRIAAAPPERIGRARVLAADLADGVRLVLDDGFVYWRASGTEPVIRVYAEAPSRGALARRLSAGLARLR
ncbi:MAG: phosphoglucomutase/phosphomannomutase family protein [Deltaproteobacteria bacterium]|nr:phosphoglucomutase/phosphomannomutase family protein [Deltaproteobacteria bacterium]